MKEFIFDHSKKKLHKAIGIERNQMIDLASKLSSIVRSLKLDVEKQEVKDCSSSEVVEACVNQLSYSELVLISAFYIKDKIDELQQQAEQEYMEKNVLESDDVPENVKEFLRTLKDKQ